MLPTHVAQAFDTVSRWCRDQDPIRTRMTYNQVTDALRDATLMRAAYMECHSLSLALMTRCDEINHTIVEKLIKKHKGEVKAMMDRGEATESANVFFKE